MATAGRERNGDLETKTRGGDQNRSSGYVQKKKTLQHTATHCQTLQHTATHVEYRKLKLEEGIKTEAAGVFDSIYTFSLAV